MSFITTIIITVNTVNYHRIDESYLWYVIFICVYDPVKICITKSLPIPY